MAADDGCLFGADSPLYCVSHWKEGVFLVAGGGGKAKTGIKNALSFHRLELCRDSNALSGRFIYTSTPVSQHDMKTDLITQCSCFTGGSSRPLLAASISSGCHIFAVKEITKSSALSKKETDDQDTDTKDGSDDDTKGSDTEPDSISLRENEDDKDLTDGSEDSDEVNQFELTETAAVTTDESLKSPCQNVVRFSSDGLFVITGGEDGRVRVWKLPDLEAVCSRRPHDAEITDIAVHPSTEVSVSVSRDGIARVWQCLTAEKEEKQFTAGKNYRFRACGFSNYKENSDFFVISIPIKLSNKSRQYCYLTKWNSEKWVELGSVRTGAVVLTSMALHDQYIAIGDTNGGVTIYTTNLKAFLRVPEVHSSFVTDVCFLPLAKDIPAAVEEKKLALLSVSVDKNCCVTEVKKKGNSWFKFVVILAVLVLLVAIFAESIWTF